jgi:hypothetical protein
MLEKYYLHDTIEKTLKLHFYLKIIHVKLQAI